MIATFRHPSRHSLWFALAIVAIGLATLTDARAGERYTMPRLEMQPLSPGARTAVDRLERAVDLELKDASIEEVLQAVSNATGAPISVSTNALDPQLRLVRVTLKATNVPARLVVMETLLPMNLLVRFTDTGVLVEKKAVEPNASKKFGTRSLRYSGDSVGTLEIEHRGDNC